MDFENFTDFKKETGLIKGKRATKKFKEEYEEDLKEFGLLNKIDETGSLDDFRGCVEGLDKFLEKHPELHIVTKCCEGIKDYWPNYAAYVNRLCYYFANGSKDTDLCFY